MRMQIGTIGLAIVLCAGMPGQAADEPPRSPAQVQRDEAQQLLKARDEARAKAEVAQQKLRDAGVSLDSLGFDGAKELRDRQAASGAKATAYDRYARKAKELEKKIQTDVRLGKRPVLCQDIARYERLQAEVDLARIAGRLPADGK